MKSVKNEIGLALEENEILQTEFKSRILEYQDKTDKMRRALEEGNPNAANCIVVYSFVINELESINSYLELRHVGLCNRLVKSAKSGVEHD